MELYTLKTLSDRLLEILAETGDPDSPVFVGETKQLDGPFSPDMSLCFVDSVEEKHGIVVIKY